jgi:hypothetical protein
MSAPVLEAIERRRKVIPDAYFAAIQKKVPMIRENHAQITGRTRNRSYFYEEAGRSDKDTLTLFQKAFDHYASIAFADITRGDLLINEVANWGSWRRQVQSPIYVLRTFEEIDDETFSLMIQRRQAYRQKNFWEVERLSGEIRKNEEEMERMRRRENENSSSAQARIAAHAF